jgi:hypothetical protein
MKIPPAVHSVDSTKPRVVWRLASLTIAIPVLLSTGCGPSGPQKITIRGMVTLDGVALPEGQVVFIPSDPSLGAAGGAIANGVFTVTTYKGPHQVEVHAEKRLPRPVPPGAPPEAGFTFVSIIPKRYNEQTTLTFDVHSPNDRPEFALTSDK